MELLWNNTVPTPSHHHASLIARRNRILPLPKAESEGGGERGARTGANRHPISVSRLVVSNNGARLRGSRVRLWRGLRR
jgi:hypothetical protein